MKNFKRISIAIFIIAGLVTGAQAQQNKKVENNVSDGNSFSHFSPIILRTIKPELAAPNSLLLLEKSSNLELKYSNLMDKAVETVRNLPLFNFIDEWYSTKYKYGGTTKKGVDCSSFTNQLINKVYGITMPRTARQQYAASIPVSDNSLKEGDLVFFNTTGGISHVGIYLVNRLFVHASSSKGVVISSLDDPYFSKRYVGAGRPASELMMNAFL
ncbi:MAG: C40 family peptidase [Ferruginibacter sp.]